MLQDRLLFRKFQRGDRHAFCRIYNKYIDDLLSLATHLLRDSAAAEDMVQDVFVRLIQSADRLKVNGSLKSYLATCVINRVRDRVRQMKRRPAVALVEAACVESHAYGPEHSFLVAEDSQRLTEALAQLPYEQQEVVMLHLHSDMKFREIAQLQKVSIKTVQSRYRYGLEKLRALVKS